MASKLVVIEERYRFYIHWEEDDELGGLLCQDKKDGLGAPPHDREEWEHWAASKAVRDLPEFQTDTFGAFWGSEKEARAALLVAKEALKQHRQLPAWAKAALAAGWKPPKGWKA